MKIDSLQDYSEFARLNGCMDDKMDDCDVNIFDSF